MLGKALRSREMSSNEIRNITRDIAQGQNATLITSDKVMAETAEVEGIEVRYGFGSPFFLRKKKRIFNERAELYKGSSMEDKEERKEYFEELGIEPKKVEEYDAGDSGVEVVEKSEEEEEKEEERREEELEQYREVSGF